MKTHAFDRWLAGAPVLGRGTGFGYWLAGAPVLELEAVAEPVVEEGWPASLPKPSLNYGFRTQVGVARSKEVDGPLQVRRRFYGGFKVVAVTWEFTNEQFLLFQGFYEHGIANGCNRFALDLPLGDGYQSQRVQFVGNGYTVEAYGHFNFRVTATLNVAAASLLTAEEVAVLLAG